MTEVLLIVNPRSGVDKSKDTMIETAARLCESRGLRLNVEFTSGPGDAERIACSGAEEGIERILCAGGDGTVREVADGLWNKAPTMGIVPMGSGNGLARSLGIPQDVEEATKIATGSHSVVIDRGRANGNSFYSAFGVGVDAEVSFQFAHDRRRGRTTYIKHAVRQMFTYRPRRFKLSSEGVSIETDALLIAVCNCMQYGNNAYISPRAIPTDGMLDVTVVHKGSFLAKALAGIDLFSGMLERNLLVEMFKTVEMRIVCEEGEPLCITHLDGEPVEMPCVIDIQCERGGLKVAVPEGVHTFKPFLTPMKCMWEDIVADIRKNL